MPGAWEFTRQRFSREAWHGLALTGAFIVVVGMIFLFAEITEGWMDQEALYRIDQSVNASIRTVLSDGTVQAINAVTYLGDTLVVLPIVLVLLVVFVVRKQQWRLVSLLTVVGLGSGLMWTLKLVFGRGRPEGLLSTPTSASFPSGHTFTAVVVYGFLIYLVWRWTDRPALRVPLTILLTLVILGVGLSRVLLSVHWVSDVLGGFTIGLAWLVFGLVFTRAARAYVMRDVASVA